MTEYDFCADEFYASNEYEARFLYKTQTKSGLYCGIEVRGIVRKYEDCRVFEEVEKAYLVDEAGRKRKIDAESDIVQEAIEAWNYMSDNVTDIEW